MFAATCCPGVTPESIETDPLQAFLMAAEYLGTFYRVNTALSSSSLLLHVIQV